jgi:ABC-type uncharacterized transport system substrate-binding protein
MNKNRISYLLILICLFFYGLASGQSHASAFKVLVVMSYDSEYPWCAEIKEGIDAVLNPVCVIEYFWMDTKKNLAAGEENAKKAYAHYLKFQPDGVIAADDNAQSMFVIPYLRNKVQTPVIFCGVNAAPQEYGYPAENVTGILEQIHIGSSIVFAQQLVPSIKKIAYILKESPSARAVFKQYQKEHETYPAESVDFNMPKTLNEALSMVQELQGKTDALFFGTMEGIRDDAGRVFTDKEIIPMLAKAYGKPIISSNLYHVEYGTLCAVIKSGQEQGKTAAEMLMKAMQGTPVSQIPITRNRHGRRVINLSVMKSLGIQPGSAAIRNAQLVGIEK